ncbi:MAG TPA: tRNA (adenosine(37)-N6)-threonylcarbamoyltransferase complex dimerization subunit type 1 TsaB [Mycobacteriales bacterium]|nr:tRNA (adenosine(37)-N6)-threonylcarbamoyltransferase complex dimerization subunit type 1 TsaB [Mycobacteriales bacterium]
MLVLALDTSSPTVAVAVCDAQGGDVRLRAERSETADNRHGERLAPLTASCLRDAGATTADLEGVVVGLGPAPFTGLRVGIMTAHAMSDALGIPAYGVCSLDGIAHRFTTDHGSFAVITDARRKQVYWALYDEGGRRIDGPELAPPDELADQLRSRTTDVVGAGVVKYRESFAGFTTREGDPAPRAVDLVWCVDFAQPPGTLAPMYLRRPDAQPPGRPKAVTPL